MISRFDYVPGQPLINTHVALPYEQLLNNVKVKQHEFDTNKAYEQMLLGQISKTRAREEDMEALKGINKSYENELNSIADSVLKDYGSSNYREKLNKLTQRLSSDLSTGDLFAIGTNYQGLQDWNKQRKEYKEGPLKNFLDEKYTNIAPGFYKGYKTTDGYNIQQPGNIDKYVDREKATDEIVKGILSEGKSGYSLSEPDAFGNRLIVNSKGEAITPEKIKSTFRPHFLQSEAYKQVLKEADHYQQLAESQGKGFDSKKFIGETIDQLERGVVAKYTHNKSDVHASLSHGQEWQYDAKNADAQMEPVVMEAVATKANVEGMKIDVSRGLSTVENTNPGGGGWGSPGQSPGLTYQSDEQVRKNLKFTPEHEVIFEKAQRKYGKITNDPIKKAEYINQYLEDFKKEGINIPVLQYSNPKIVEKENKIFFGQDEKGAIAAINRPFKLITGEGNTELSGKDFLKQFADRKKYSINITGQLTADNPLFPSGKQVTVTDDSGETVAIYAMGGNRAENDKNQFKHEFYKAKYSPSGQNKVTIPVDDGKGGTKNETYTVDYETVTGNTYDEEGNLQNIGSRVRFLDSKGQPVVDWLSDGHDEQGNPRSAIDLLYNSLLTK